MSFEYLCNLCSTYDALVTAITLNLKYDSNFKIQILRQTKVIKLTSLICIQMLTHKNNYKEKPWLNMRIQKCRPWVNFAN
jgi:hypothetical protein